MLVSTGFQSEISKILQCETENVYDQSYELTGSKFEWNKDIQNSETDDVHYNIH